MNDGDRPSHRSDDISAVWHVGDRFLDEFEVTKIIGQGGMGIVYKVHNRWLWTTWAVKSPQPKNLVGADGKEMFVREAETWANLAEHPHIVTCRFVRTLAGIPRIFIDYIEGGSLADWIGQGGLYQGGPKRALERILDVAIQFAWGLHAAHEHRLVHQDVKPANVLMTSQGIAKVTDFGLAQARWRAGERTASGRAGASGVVPGVGLMTREYASPEQVAGQPLTRKTDIWSWAVSVLDLFVGAIDRGYGPAAAEALEKYLAAGPPNSALPQMPFGVVRLLQQCFQHDPADRPATMQEVALELQNIYKRLLGQPYAREVPAFQEKGIVGLYYQALSLRELERNEKALAVLEQCVRSFSWQVVASLTKGAILEGLRIEKTQNIWASRGFDLDPQQRAALHLSKNKGATLLEFGDVKAALATWGRNIQLDPHQAAAHLDKSAALLERGRFNEALAALKQDIQLDPHRLSPQLYEPHYNKDLVLRDLERLKKALATYQWYLRLGPWSIFAHHYEASPLVRVGEPTTYQQEIQFDSRGTPLHHDFPGLVLKERRKAVERGRAEEAEALAAFDQSLQFDPQDAFASFGKGAVLYELGRVEEALAAFDQGLRLDPQLTPALLCKGLLCKGMALNSLGRLTEALATFDQSLRLDPQSAFAYLCKGAALNSCGCFTEALSACEQSLRFDPQQAVTYFNKGMALLGLERGTEALAAFDQSSQLDPQSAFAQDSKGSVLQRLRRIEQADALYYKGLVLHSLRRFAEALAAFDRCLQLDPQRADAHFGKGVALLELRRGREALVAYEQGLRLDPWQTATHFNRGLLLGDLAHSGSESGVLASVGVLRYPGRVLSSYYPPKREENGAGKAAIATLRVVVLFLAGLLLYLWVPLDRPSSFNLIQAVISRVLEGLYLQGGLSLALLLLLAGKEVREWASSVVDAFFMIIEAFLKRSHARHSLRAMLGVLCLVAQMIWFRPDFTWWGEVVLVALFVLWALLMRTMKQIADFYYKERSL
jgi:tetratricopeptide (TPR) repeat protein